MERFVRLDYPGSGSVAVVGGADRGLPGRVQSSFAQVVPSGLEAEVGGDPTGMVVTLTWDGVAGAARYQITRAKAGGAGTTAVTDGPGSSWFDTDVAPGTYTYAVAVVDVTGRVGAASRPIRVLVGDPRSGGLPVVPITTDPGWTPRPTNPAWAWHPSPTKPVWGYALGDMDSPMRFSYVDIGDLPGATFDLPQAITARPRVVSMLNDLASSGLGGEVRIQLARVPDLTSDRPYLSIGTTSSWLDDALGDGAKLTDVCGLTTDLKRFGLGLAIRIDDPYRA